ncbi:hypothetical protein ACFW04_003594 [Cataglyphis niger]
MHLMVVQFKPTVDRATRYSRGIECNMLCINPWKQTIRCTRHNKDEWRAALDSTFINDDGWWCIVTMMVETIVEHSRYVSLFNEAAEEGERTCIYSLSHQKAIDTVKTLSKQDPEKCPAIVGICHYANALLNENNGHLSTWLIARIIKYLIYRAKIEQIERLEVQADLDREIDEEYPAIPNIVCSTSSQNTRSQKVRNNEAEYAFNGKIKARSREDVPFEGPNLYIVLSGFYDPDLPAELLDIGVPLTCILEMKLPNERYAYQTKEEDFISSDKTSFSENYRIDVNELNKFWTITRERFANLSTYPIYSDITILIFSPAVLPETFTENEKEFLKQDIYDRALRILYHLYDLCLQHVKYLKSMRLEKRIVDKREETMDTKIYEDALSNIPNEYINVPLILGAILLQVESNLARSYDECVSIKRNTGFSDTDTRHANTSMTAERIPVFAVPDKLRLLNLEYELIDEYADNTGQSLIFDLEVIPYGDTLRMIVRCFLQQRFIDLDDAVLLVLRDPRIINIWQNREVLPRSKSDMYFCHINNIASTFNQEQTVSREEVVHYLHLLMFDKLIFSEDELIFYDARAELTQPLKEDLSTSKHAQTTIKKTHSVSNLTALPVPSLRRIKSDTEIDYDKPIIAFIECPLLFALTDFRETLLPGYLHENIFKKRSYERSSLEEYEDVELFSNRVFLQVIHDCFQRFDRFSARYFEPTDSMLLYFSNNNRVDDAFEEKSTSFIPTSIGLREFCEYIAEEEENWIERERETRQSLRCRMDLTGRFMKGFIEVEDEAIIFADECFVLSDSLKARHLKKSPDRDLRKKIFETKESEEVKIGENVEGKIITTEQKRNGTLTADNGSKQANGKVMNGKTSLMKKKSATKIDDVDTSFLSVKKILSSRYVEKDESYDFVGYDLGSLRVQVIHHSKKFILDDTTVRVELEDWLHGDLDVRIAIISQYCTLRLSSGGDRRQSEDAFHLITERGIVLSFCRSKNKDFDAVQSLSNCHWQNLAFDFRASWPSGLLIEPAIGDGTKDPFCIRQSYVSKRLGCASAAHEVYRNFLRNGTVLKYMDDNTVVILRPNSVIVTCMDFDKSQSYDESIQTTLKEFSNEKRNSVAAKSREKVMGSTEPRSNGSIGDEQPSKQRILSPGERVTVNDGVDSLIIGANKVLRYSVVNYDGRHYEVLNDLVVSEHDRLLVRTTSDYEVNEVFTRRADGTDTLLRSNGELVVIFPDGTRIITGYTIEEQPVICEWSEDELQQYFGYDGRINVASSHDSAFSHEDPPAPYVDYRDELTGISIADGFVSILLTFRMEHEDYASVSYDQSAVGCTLSMPDNLRVSISREGHYEVSMEDKVNLKIRDDVTFSKICATCGGRSISTYKFRKSSDAGPQTILTTIDILGNVLEVKSDGTTSYRHPYRRRESDEGEEEESDEGESDEGESDKRESDEGVSDEGVSDEGVSDEGEDGNSGTRIHRKHERYCEMLKFPERSQYRIFAMNRDLTACEYLHRSVRREQELAAVLGDETSMIQYPISRRPELRRLITFMPMEPESGSKEISGSCQYRIRSDKRTGYEKTELLRSTYSFPYNWLFPFGKRDQRVPQRIEREVLAKRNEQPLPKLLRVRVFFGIKEADRNALIDMQRAMGRYWISVFRDGDKCWLFCATGSSRPCEVENDYGSSERSLRELALGVKGSIDVETYVRSLQGKLIKVSTKAPQQSSRLAELLRQRASMKEEYEWYKQCLKKRIIIPYFRNIGLCYSLMKDYVDEAILKKNYSHVWCTRPLFKFLPLGDFGARGRNTETSKSKVEVSVLKERQPL